jgi:hypothetical protein
MNFDQRLITIGRELVVDDRILDHEASFETQNIVRLSSGTDTDNFLDHEASFETQRSGAYPPTLTLTTSWTTKHHLKRKVRALILRH